MNKEEIKLVNGGMKNLSFSLRLNQQEVKLLEKRGYFVQPFGSDECIYVGEGNLALPITGSENEYLVREKNSKRWACLDELNDIIEKVGLVEDK